ncbi:hypothetical protein AURDEDRAFT_173787 [Auricularia subglabra TFB-10046 SS5]|nr:hypothetical protein AURDEDRAFT_173787 [Auricularia subglabra TFB-10046 SS5]
MLADFLKLHPGAVFPHVRTLVAHSGTLQITDVFASAFPSLISLGVSHPDVTKIDTLWPGLVHLQAYLHDIGFWGDRGLSSRHPIQSLHLRFTGDVIITRLNMLRAWASPHVRALVLDWPFARFGVHSTVLQAYSGLTLLDIQLHLGVKEWIKSAMRLLVLPPLEVLTLRKARDIQDLSDAALDPLRTRIPSLCLVRVTSEYSEARAVFAWSGLVDWREACEIVADHLPRWRETCAPWDDVQTI